MEIISQSLGQSSECTCPEPVCFRTGREREKITDEATSEQTVIVALPLYFVTIRIDKECY
jgi:hypothetical protein